MCSSAGGRSKWEVSVGLLSVFVTSNSSNSPMVSLTGVEISGGEQRNSGWYRFPERIFTVTSEQQRHLLVERLHYSFTFNKVVFSKTSYTVFDRYSVCVCVCSLNNAVAACFAVDVRPSSGNAWSLFGLV